MPIRHLGSHKGPSSEWFDEVDANGNTAKLDELLRGASEGGGGVLPSQLDRFQVQEGLSCQTMAIIEGLRAVSPRSVSSLGTHAHLRSIVRGLRDRIKQRAPGATDAHFDDESLRVESAFDAIAESTNLPITREPLYDAPPEAIRKLFEAGPKKRFIVAVDRAGNTQAIGHAYAIVPVAHATEKRFAVKIDTLFGRRHPTDPSSIIAENLTLEQVVDRMRGHFDNVSPRFQLHLITIDETHLAHESALPTPPQLPSGTPGTKVIRVGSVTGNPETPASKSTGEVIRITKPEVIRITKPETIRIQFPKEPS
jgi:hypothetical protein